MQRTYPIIFFACIFLAGVSFSMVLIISIILILKIDRIFRFVQKHYDCSSCGATDKTKEPTLPILDLSKYFRPISTYSIQPDNLEQEFFRFNSSIGVVKQTLESIKGNRIASLLSHLLTVNLLQFDIWLRDIQKLDKFNKLYVLDIYAADKNYLIKNGESIKEFEQSMFKELDKILASHENHADCMKKKLQKIAQLMHEEITMRNNQLVNIDELLKVTKISSKLMRQILDNVRPYLSLETVKTVEIIYELKLCELIVIDERNAVKKAKKI